MRGNCGGNTLRLARSASSWRSQGARATVESALSARAPSEKKAPATVSVKSPATMTGVGGRSRIPLIRTSGGGGSLPPGLGLATARETEAQQRGAEQRQRGRNGHGRDEGIA